LTFGGIAFVGMVALAALILYWGCHGTIKAFCRAVFIFRSSKRFLLKKYLHQQI
jgi:hypothetical protein